MLSKLYKLATLGIVLASGSLLPLFDATYAQAQGQQQAGSSSTDVEEVVVTARRREEKLQEVPLSVTAFSASALSEQRVQNSSDLAYLVPSFTTYSDTGRDEQFFTLRGITNQPGGPGVVAYFNEVPDLNAPQLGGTGATGGAAGPGRFFDLDNAQVLKGPQGTLFGKNTIGGAILLYPKKPTNDYSGYAQATFGNYSDIELEAATNIPIVPDKLLVRISGQRAQRDGFTKDLENGKDLDNRDYWVGRLSVIARPVEGLENYLVVDDVYSHTNGTSYILRGADPCFSYGPGVTLGPCGASFAIVPNLPKLLAQQQKIGVRAITGNFSGSNVGSLDRTEHWSVSNVTTFDVSDTVTLKNIFGYHNFKQLFRESESDLGFLDYTNPTGLSWNLEAFTDELQIQGKSLDNNLVWQAGAYGSYDHTNGASSTSSVFFDPANPQMQTTQFANRSLAVYAQGTYDLGNILPDLEGLKFTAGYRYNWDYRSIAVTSETAGVCTAGFGLDPANPTLNSPPYCTQAGGVHFQAPNWTLGLDYQLTPQTLIYITGRRGYITGGVNPENYIAGTQTYKPEVLDDIELGVKSDWTVGGMKARTNVDVFRSYFKSVQNSSSFDFGQVSIVENNGKVTVTGVELETTLEPNLWDGFQLKGSYAYNYAHYNEINNIILPPGTVLNPTIAAVPQNKFSLTAKQKFTFIPEEYGDFSGQVTWNYQTHSNFGGLIYYAKGSEQAAYGVVNLRMDWENAYGYPVDLSFFMTNVLDRVYQAGNFPVFEVGGFYSAVYAEPRMFGFQAKYHW